MASKRFDRSSLPDAPDFSFEMALWFRDIKWVGGVDEAGRGALAGPVAAAVVVFPPVLDLEHRLKGVRDSKQMTPAARTDWARRLLSLAQTCGIGFASNDKIDKIGIVPATRLAVQRALAALTPSPKHLLVDYLHLPDCDLPQTPLVKGDARSLSIAAASILAKTARDDLMERMDVDYPGYGFKQHKGYGTVMHREALTRLGPCPMHRRSFRYSSPTPSQGSNDKEP